MSKGGKRLVPLPRKNLTLSKTLLGVTEEDLHSDVLPYRDHTTYPPLPTSLLPTSLLLRYIFIHWYLLPISFLSPCFQQHNSRSGFVLDLPCHFNTIYITILIAITSLCDRSFNSLHGLARCEGKSVASTFR